MFYQFNLINWLDILDINIFIHMKRIFPFCGRFGCSLEMGALLSQFALSFTTSCIYVFVNYLSRERGKILFNYLPNYALYLKETKRKKKIPVFSTHIYEKWSNFPLQAKGTVKSLMCFRHFSNVFGIFILCLVLLLLFLLMRVKSLRCCGVLR